MRSGIKQKFGICPDCPEGSKEKLLTAKRCIFHNEIFKAEQREFKQQAKAKLNAFLGVPPKEQKKPKPIPKVSEKRKVENREYTIKRLQFLAQPENQKCFIEGCNAKADTIEHTAGRWGDNYLNTDTWKPCCNFHNLELERNSELSQKYQLSKITGKEKLQKQQFKNL